MGSTKLKNRQFQMQKVKVSLQHKFFCVFNLQKNFKNIRGQLNNGCEQSFLPLFLSSLNIGIDRKDGLDAVYFFLSWLSF